MRAQWNGKILSPSMKGEHNQTKLKWMKAKKQQNYLNVNSIAHTLTKATKKWNWIQEEKNAGFEAYTSGSHRYTLFPMRNSFKAMWFNGNECKEV